MEYLNFDNLLSSSSGKKEYMCLYILLIHTHTHTHAFCLPKHTIDKSKMSKKRQNLNDGKSRW